jgi:hypothetical protein
MAEKSNILEVPVREARDINGLVKYFDQNKIYQKSHTSLFIKTEPDYSSVVVSGLLLVVGMALLILEEKGRFKTKISSRDSSLRDFRNQLAHTGSYTSIEKLIEKRYDINIIIGSIIAQSAKEQKKVSESDIDNIFGMWKGKNISLDKIRENQWARKR